MRNPSRLRDFISISAYTNAVDIKKLKFIFSALDKYCSSNDKEFKSLRVLEVACGSGGITLPLASLGCQVTAFDIDKKSVDHLQSQINQKRIKNLTVTVDDGYTFDDGKAYDIVVASEVFEHVTDPSRLAENVARRMKEGSYLIVTTPNGYGPWEIKNRVDPCTYLKKWNTLRSLLRKPLYVKGSDAGHCQFYSRGRLLHLFSKFSMVLVDFAKSDSFLSIFRPLRRSFLLGSIDIRLADILPYWLASGWYFVFELQNKSNECPTTRSA